MNVRLADEYKEPANKIRRCLEWKDEYDWHTKNESADTIGWWIKWMDDNELADEG